jgi:hypothetical protein
VRVAQYRHRRAGFRSLLVAVSVGVLGALYASGWLAGICNEIGRLFSKIA